MANTIHFPPERTAKHLFDKYVENRGISKETVKACGLEVAGRDECLATIQSTRKTNYTFGILIPHDEHYTTVRWLGGNTSDFGTKLKEDPKMLAPKGPPRVYTPPLPACSGENFSGTVYLCESAIKAISMAQHGYYAIAGNGVDGIYTSKGFSEGFPTTLFESGVERAVILFDSDFITNANVSAAIRRQATGITNLFPKVIVEHKGVTPKEDGSHQGIDDAIHERGVEWLHEWLAADIDVSKVEISPLQRHLDELNESYTVTRHPAMIRDRVHRTRISRADLVDVVEAHRCYEEPRPKGPPKKIAPAVEWLKWEGRNSQDALMYRPGSGEFGEYKGMTYYNSWVDDGVEACAGDVELFLAVYKNAIPCDIERTLLLESMAWIMQNRGVRLEKCFALVGADQGTGKSLLVETFGEIVGDGNFASISPHNFSNNFNSSLVGREVILMDDAGKLQTNSKGQFKNFVTGKTFMAEYKGKDSVKVESSAVLFITSNEFDSIPLDPEDRRVHVCAVNPAVHYEQGSQWWKDYISWLESGGYGHIRAWLESLDLSEYDPNFMPPKTSIKEHMLQSGMDDLQIWVENLHENLDAELGRNKRSFYKVQELAMIYHGHAWGKLEIGVQEETTDKLGQYLKKRFMKVGRGAIRTAQGRANFWGIRQEGGVDVSAAKVRADVKKHGTIWLE